MNKKLLTLSTAAFAAAITLAGCDGGSGSGTTTTGTDTTGAASATASATAPTGSATVAAEHNAADTVFAQKMIPHHAQAVEMSDMMLAKKDIPANVRTLAEKIKAAQGPEIETMTGWLRSWNEPTEAPGGRGMGTHGSGSGSGMGSGMMGAEDLRRLDAAQGTEAAKLFLTQMTAHHQGAILMAKTEESTGQNADAVALAKAIITSQEKEIQEMRDLLATL